MHATEDVYIEKGRKLSLYNLTDRQTNTFALDCPTLLLLSLLSQKLRSLGDSLRSLPR